MLSRLLGSRTVWTAIVMLIATTLQKTGIADVSSDSLQSAIDTIISAIQVVGPIATAIFYGISKRPPA